MMTPTEYKQHRDRMTNPRMPEGNIGDWQGRHLSAVQHPRVGLERAVRDMLISWLLYADEHRQRYESGIGEDGVLGDEWAKIGLGVRGLLNGECGRLDCGTLDWVILSALDAEGFDENGDSK